MNKEQKERVFLMLTKAWTFRGIAPEAFQDENGEIQRIVFERDGKGLMEPLCWCYDKGCQDCGNTRVKEDNEFFRCRFTCNRLKKCYLCS
ncbi:hypothetical protein [Brazilian marseillevirus]|uniref:hypothetical protein n=1 Tax=Brazilian marseillevirus TaxID=1813599 RepID=UPI0007830B14|nr:hypothetical protein A3303_gp066 [Brazilian marseillevirus]AMQ10574.1 hypothetical protein [Brazilian marseillevirus]